jgi:hypothetical protein
VADDRFTIKVTGDDDYERKLAQLRLFVDDLRPFWPLLVPVFIGWMGAQFATEGGWGGRTWAPLSPAYAQWKAAHYPGRSILIREGAMRRAASAPRREASPRKLVLWIDDPKAPLHQEGGSGGRRRASTGHTGYGSGLRAGSRVAAVSSGRSGLPARPLIPDVLPPSAVREVEHVAEEYVSTLVRRIGL